MFIWDSKKNDYNIKQHGISFNIAIHVFEDPNHIVIYDMEHSVKEDRYVVLGIVDKVLFVVYTERGNDIRIISARKATKEERRVYYGRCLY